MLLLKYRRGWIWAALGIFAVALAPVLGLVPFGHQEISTVADRYLYPSMLGLALVGLVYCQPSSAVQFRGGGLGSCPALLLGSVPD